MKTVAATPAIATEIRRVFKNSPILCAVEPHRVEALATAGVMAHYSKGEIIFHEGSAGTELFVILQGEISVLRKDPKGAEIELARFRAGDFFGELNAICQGQRTAGARAVEECMLLPLDGHQLFGESDPSKLVRLLVAEIAKRIYAMNGRYLDTIHQQHEEMQRLGRLADLGEMTAGIAHELGTPIQCMVMGLDQATDHIRQGQEFIEHGNNDKIVLHFIKLEKQMEQLARLAGELARILTDTNRYSYQNLSRLASFDLRQGMDAMLGLLRHELRGKVELQREFGDIPELICYPSKLNQVFLNLLTNAVHALEGKGKITVRISQQEGLIAVEVEDTGPGIPEDKVEKIFGKFFTTKPEGKGTGLGLYLAKQIAEEHRGTLRLAHSKPGKTVFRLELPLDNKLEE